MDCELWPASSKFSFMSFAAMVMRSASIGTFGMFASQLSEDCPYFRNFCPVVTIGACEVGAYG